MPGKIFTTYTDFSNVPATGVASASLPIGKTIEQIHLQLGGTTFAKANVTAVKVKANAKTIFDLSAAQIDKMLAYRGHSVTTDVITIDFTEQFGRDVFDVLAGGFDTSIGITSLSLEVTISGATSPTIKMQVMQSAPQGRQGSVLGALAGHIAMVSRTAYNISAAGNLQILLPNGSSGGYVKRIHVEHGTASNITDLKLKQGGIEVYQSTKALNDAFLKHNRKTVQALWASLEFVPDGNSPTWLNTKGGEQVELVPTFGALDSGYVIVESYNTLDRAV